MTFPLSFQDMFGGNENKNPPRDNDGEDLPVHDSDANDRLKNINDIQQRHLNNFEEFANRDKKSDKIRSPKEKIDFKLSKMWDKLKINKLFPAMFGLLGKISSGIWNRMSGVFGDIMELMMFALVDPKGSMLVGFINALIPLFMNLIVLITNVFISVIPTILKVFLDALPKIIELLTNAFVAVLQMLPMVVNMIIKAVPVLFKAIVKSIPLILDAFIESFNIIKKELFKIPAIKGMFDKIEEKTNKIKQYFTDMYKKTKETFDTIGTKIKEIKENVMSFVNDYVLPFFKSIKESFMKNFEPIKEAFIKIFNSLSIAISSSLETRVKLLKDGFKGLTEILEIIYNKSLPVFDQIMTTIKDLFLKISDAFEKLLPIFLDAMGTLNKIKESILPKLIQVFKFIANLVMDYLPIIISIIGDTIGFLIDSFVFLVEIIAPVILFFVDVGIQLFDMLWMVGEIIWDLTSIVLTPFIWVLEQVFSVVGFFLGLLWKLYITYLHPIVKFIVTKLFDAFKVLTFFFLNLGKIILDGIKSMIEKIKNILNDIKIPKIGELFSKALNAAFDSAPIQKIKSIFKGIMDIIEDSAVYKAWKKLKGAFTSDDSAEKILSAKERIKDKLKDEKRAEYLATYIYKGKEDARSKGTSLGLTSEIMQSLEDIGDNLVEANGGKEETQKLFYDGNIVNAIEKLAKELKGKKDQKSKNMEVIVKGSE